MTMKKICLALPVLGLAMSLAQAAPPVGAPDLDLTIQYYNKTQSPDGVTREARYEEKMLRRANHVWVARTLPKDLPQEADSAALHKASAKPGTKADDKSGKLAKAGTGEHAQFNYVVLPRHVVLENGKVRIEFINPAHKEVVSVPPAEYDNVAFDGSWDNAAFLLDPKLMKALPLSKRASGVAGAQWRESEQNGVFQRVLWDEQKQIPLIIEIGDKAQTRFRRVEVKLEPSLSSHLPWQNLAGFVKKEYSDFLD
jgi:hypothetical protein